MGSTNSTLAQSQPTQRLEALHKHLRLFSNTTISSPIPVYEFFTIIEHHLGKEKYNEITARIVNRSFKKYSTLLLPSALSSLHISRMEISNEIRQLAIWEEDEDFYFPRASKKKISFDDYLSSIPKSSQVPPTELQNFKIVLYFDETANLFASEFASQYQAHFSIANVSFYVNEYEQDYHSSEYVVPVLTTRPGSQGEPPVMLYSSFHTATQGKGLPDEEVEVGNVLPFMMKRLLADKYPTSLTLESSNKNSNKVTLRFLKEDGILFNGTMWYQRVGDVSFVGAYKPNLKLELRSGELVRFQVTGLNIDRQLLVKTTPGEDNKTIDLRINNDADGTLIYLFKTGRWCALEQLDILLANYTIHRIADDLAIDYGDTPSGFRKDLIPEMFLQLFGKLDISVSAFLNKQATKLGTAYVAREVKPSLGFQDCLLGCIDVDAKLTFTKVPVMAISKMTLKTRSITNLNILSGYLPLDQQVWKGSCIYLRQKYDMKLSQLLHELYWLEISAPREQLQEVLDVLCFSITAAMDTAKATLTLNILLDDGSVIQIVVDSHRSGYMTVRSLASEQKAPLKLSVAVSLSAGRSQSASRALLNVRLFKDIKIVL